MVLEKNWKLLIRPDKTVTEHGFDPARKAKLIAEPLERGFGMTLGNALRRLCAALRSHRYRSMVWYMSFRPSRVSAKT
jgi:RNA polymerase Rpb3/Rpb11 dimerisation domain